MLAHGVSGLLSKTKDVGDTYTSFNVRGSLTAVCQGLDGFVGGQEHVNRSIVFLVWGVP